MIHQNYIIERMNEDEVELAVAWAAKEGWNPGLHDAACFYQTDPNGFFAGKLNGKIIAVGSAVVYDQQFAFCGLYIVDKAYRGQGYGLELTNARLAYVGARNAGIDGVTPMLSKYVRLGYRMAYNNARYASSSSYEDLESEAVVLAQDVDFNELCQFDRRHFPALRAKFLRCWLSQPDSLGLVYVSNQKIKGYGVIRRCMKGFKIGPLFAEEYDIAQVLFQKLAHHAQGLPVYLDIPECNQQAQTLVHRFGMTKTFETARMYLKGAPKIELDNIYGITTFELG